MGRYRRKRMHKNIKDIKKKYKTKRRTKVRALGACLEVVMAVMREGSAKLWEKYL